MNLLYSLGIRIYGGILWVAQFFNPKAKSWILGRKHFWEKLPNVENREIYWFHCASLGEFDQGLPMMNLIKEHNPSIYILVTFFSPSGFENYHKRKNSADFVCYLPLDTKSNARKFIQHFKPTKVFFIKYEFWTNYIFEAKKSNAKIYSISALFRSDHRFFKWYGNQFRETLRKIDFFFVQNQSSLELLQSIGINKAILTGDTRFDRVIENKADVQKDSTIEAFIQNQKAFVIGSSWPEDEDLLQKLISSCVLPVIIAPHDISENHLRQIEKKFENETARYSNWTLKSNKKILLIDSIGKLANAYSYGQIAFIGGGFSGNLHNILEPAVFGLPVIFGPKHKRFPEAQTFIDAGIGFSVTDEETLHFAFNNIIQNQENLKIKTTDLVLASQGATQKIIDFLEKN
jgi:3-deoxy-D-manno-octulosonic-acid transferase